MDENTGVNRSEKYLNALGKRSFLSLWSYSNVFYKQGKELTDLLVICGNEIIIFQDKGSDFPSSGDIYQDWKRWFKRTVTAGAGQVWKAERIIRRGFNKIYLDASCSVPYPIPLPKLSEAKFHLVIVTHGGSARCRELLGGSGSFMIHSDIKSIKEHEEPFVIGDLDAARTFVHVLDDTTLDILMTTLDTITDFTLYLRKKEKLLRGPIPIITTGDEELLANYLRNVNSSGDEHDFNFNIPSSGPVAGIALAEGGWESFRTNPQRLAQIEQDRISYFWDDLIESFSMHAAAGTQYLVPGVNNLNPSGSLEKVMRFMAQEPRFMRRTLSSSFKDVFKKTNANQSARRVIQSSANPLLYYVILLFPLPLGSKYTFDEYRRMRAMYLEGTCMSAKLLRPDAKHIIGIATEAGVDNGGRSEDAAYLDVSQWTPEMEASAKKFREEQRVLVNPTETRLHQVEYPEVASIKDFLKNPRNKPCPCGSGIKYKNCCGRKGRIFYKDIE